MIRDPNPTPAVSKTAPESVAEGIAQDSALAQLARDYLKERKSRRRWGIFFKFLLVGYILSVTAWFFLDEYARQGVPHTAVVEINGIIASLENSSGQVVESLNNAFEAEDSRGVIVKINSPGGTPVQAAIINAEIHRLKSVYPDKPVFVSIGDVCTSGGYYVAVAADQIYAHPSSIVGSIGVQINTFGLTGAMEKLGIERRLFTAGEHKSMLDPFSPSQPRHIRHIRSMLDDVHQQFVDAVKRGRGNRITNDPDLFSGLIWSGKQARVLGLIDHFGTAETIAREVIGYEEIVDYTHYPDFFGQFARQAGVRISDYLSSVFHSMF